ncbi:MAG: hypothetical protein ABIP51_21545 [Bacteroidia bacterium]
MHNFSKEDIQLIKYRKMSIFADIKFDDEQKNKLKKLMSEISITGETMYLNNSDLFFSYDKERDIWSGSKNTNLPYKKLENNSNS